VIDEIAQQLDDVRTEMLQLLQEYSEANEFGREYIYQRCESLGGEIQELVSLLKLHIRTANQQVGVEKQNDPAYAAEIDRVSQASLAAVHSAGLEVAEAIRMLRETRPDAENPDEYDLQP